MSGQNYFGPCYTLRVNNFIKSPLSAIFTGVISGLLVGFYISQTGGYESDEMFFFGFVFGLPTSLYLVLLLSKLKRRWIDFMKVFVIWVPASGASWYLALQAGFSNHNLFFTDVSDGMFAVILIGGFVGAAIMGAAFATISKNDFGYSLMFILLLSICAAIAAVSGFFLDFFLDEDVQFIMHILWQTTILYLIHRNLFVNNSEELVEQVYR